MGRSVFGGRKLNGLGIIVGLLFLVTLTAGCGNNGAVHTSTFVVPASITLSPGPDFSMELGTNQSFTASLFNSTRGTLTEPVSFQSSNTAVVSVAGNGLACAGSWDSLNNPQICTPGAIGIAVITATAQGVSSPPTTVYVHQHIDKVTVKEIPPPPPLPPPLPGCSSVNQARYYAAQAFSQGADITSTVGVFNWQSLFPTVGSLSTTANGLLTGQLQVTAKIPGQTQIFAAIGNATSVPIIFTTCAVQSIALEVTSSTGTSEAITPTVVDTLGFTIPTASVPLTWSSSEPGSATVSTAGGVTASANGGGATIIASCTPPTCNLGFFPSLPIYPETAVTIFTAGTSTTGTVYATSSGCGVVDGCFADIATITAPANTVGTSITLPDTPNSLVFNRQGTKAYLGTNSGLLGSAGLTVLDATANSITKITALPGSVLAVSPDGNKVVISDTSPADGPNRVFVFDTTNNTSVTFQITGATAAAFSPDSLKAYIIAGSRLFVYSKIDALKTILLNAPANDVDFLSEGAFAYIAGGDPKGVMTRRTCDNGLADLAQTSVVPRFIRTLPGPSQLVGGDTADTFHLLAVTSPNVDLISAAPPPNTPPFVWEGCTPAVLDTSHAFNLGVGNFTPKQLIVSQDGSTAYILTSSPGSILVINIAGQTATARTLTGNATPLSAALAPNGSVLYVGANDGTVHVIDTVVGGDIQQVSFPQTLCRNAAGLQFVGVTCNPDLVAVKP